MGTFMKIVIATCNQSVHTYYIGLGFMQVNLVKKFEARTLHYWGWHEAGTGMGAPRATLKDCSQ